MHNCDQVKPECLAIFLIESYFFLSYLFLSVSPYPYLVPPVTHFLCQLCIRLVLTILMEGEAQCTGTRGKERKAVGNLSMLTSYCYIRYTCR